MILAFFPRLLCLALACFFLTNAATALAVAACAPRAIRKARELEARQAARFFLTLRLLPFGFSLFAAVGLCLPSYLLFEPERFDEPVGVACLIVAAAGLALCGIAFWRAVRASLTSILFTRRCRRSGRQLAPGILVVECSEPLLALTGIVRPQVVISRKIAEAFSDEELGVVLGHENAHRDSWDNLKRLCIFLCPWYVLKGGAELERAWIRSAEFRADERAAAGDAGRSLALASALVRVARAGNMRHLAPVGISFLAEASDLPARVDRLLTRSPYTETAPVRRYRAVLALAFCLVPFVFTPSIFRFVQTILERLVR